MPGPALTRSINMLMACVVGVHATLLIRTGSSLYWVLCSMAAAGAVMFLGHFAEDRAERPIENGTL